MPLKVTHVAVRPTEASLAAGRPSLTPELLAASGARYSRSNDGLESILAKIDPENLDKSVDGIFRMLDYGHASIADMVPVALFIDGISLWLAYYVWTLCPVAGGQESSTRYLRLGEGGLVPPDVLGIPAADREAWGQGMATAFEAYREAVAVWEAVVRADPEAARIPRALQEDPSDKARKTVARMRRNYAFDRARYFLPVAAATNVMLIMSARAWVTLIQHLLSHPLPEANRLGAACREEMGYSAPRLRKHAGAQSSLASGLRQEFAATQALAATLPFAGTGEHPPTPYLETLPPPGGLTGLQAAADLTLHENRYAYVGETLRRTAVRFGWEAVALAEIRDLNRHRTGTKYCPLVPVGFYCASDQLPTSNVAYAALGEMAATATGKAGQQLAAGNPAYIYHTLLGAQYPFEHTTTADKFLYEAELRTGTGAHYRYARHLHDVLALWYARYPETRGLIREGSAEPE
ncbi:MAG: FAD-dependent thymidylate synthase [Cytophagales bacterium]|nr:FAD-dependent thymidylate synthase [Armatimonadota bacterium]